MPPFIPPHLSYEEIRVEKQASRAADQHALDSGCLSQEALAARNVFAPASRLKLHLERAVPLRKSRAY